MALQQLFFRTDSSANYDGIPAISLGVKDSLPSPLDDLLGDDCGDAADYQGKKDANVVNVTQICTGAVEMARAGIHAVRWNVVEARVEFRLERLPAVVVPIRCTSWLAGAAAAAIIFVPSFAAIFTPLFRP